MQRSIKELLSLKVYLSWLLPVLVYAFFLRWISTQPNYWRRAIGW